MPPMAPVAVSIVASTGRISSKMTAPAGDVQTIEKVKVPVGSIGWVVGAIVSFDTMSSPVALTMPSPFEPLTIVTVPGL